jgi:transcriptional regulator with XRE-family HTH domain
LYSAGVRAAAPSDPDDLRSWLRQLREASGLSQEALASAVGTDRRNIHRWEVQGHDPGGSALLRVLSALGVRIEPPPPTGIPRAVNAELHELQEELRRAADEAAVRQDELLRRLDELGARIVDLSARLDEASRLQQP